MGECDQITKKSYETNKVNSYIIILDFSIAAYYAKMFMDNITLYLMIQ